MSHIETRKRLVAVRAVVILGDVARLRRGGIDPFGKRVVAEESQTLGKVLLDFGCEPLIIGPVSVINGSQDRLIR